MPKTYNTPKRSHIVKTRLDDEEYSEFMRRMELYGMNQSEFLRQAITGAPVRPIITVHPVNDELLSVLGKITAEYGKIGSFEQHVVEITRGVNGILVGNGRRSGSGIVGFAVAGAEHCGHTKDCE